MRDRDWRDAGPTCDVLPARTQDAPLRVESLRRLHDPAAGLSKRLFPVAHYIATGREAIPDFRAEVQQQLTQGDRVARHWVFTGTHQGKLFGVPPTGKSVRFQNISIATVVDQQVVQYDSETGWLDFLMQVGALPLK